MENQTELKIKVLYLDDEKVDLKSFKVIFSKKFEIYITTDPNEALKFIEENDIPIVISDLKMSEFSGIDFFKIVFDKFPLTKRILLTGYVEINDLIMAVNECSIAKLLVKPWEENSLASIINELNNQYLNEKLVLDKAEKLEMVSIERDMYKQESYQIEFILRQKLLNN